MKPPLSRKNIDDSQKFESYSNEGKKDIEVTRKNFIPSAGFNEEKSYSPPKNIGQMPSFNQSSNIEEVKEIKKMMNDQIDFQKKSFDKLLTEEKDFRKQQIEKLKKNHE